ncbi:MAG: tetrahydrofolate dehydrogenase/cyclohydrolase catalytic domain-containing protein, partial [Candidatus Margulisiibacteriota bacterium]
MTAQIIDGKAVAQKVRDEIKKQTAKLEVKPGLAVVLVGNNAASATYVNMKKKACAELGFNSFSYELAEETSEKELLDLIAELNENDEVHGILVQLPVPKHISTEKVIFAIAPE